jgi:hypothetical protein
MTMTNPQTEFDPIISTASGQLKHLFKIEFRTGKTDEGIFHEELPFHFLSIPVQGQMERGRGVRSCITNPGEKPEGVY